MVTKTFIIASIPYFLVSYESKTLYGITKLRKVTEWWSSRKDTIRNN